MAQIPGSNISAGVRPNDSADTYDTHSAEFGRGGWHTGHTDIAARNAIPVERRQWWMVVPTLDGKKYELVPGYVSQNLQDNGNWREMALAAPTAAQVFALLEQGPGILIEMTAGGKVRISTTGTTTETVTILDVQGDDAVAITNVQAS